CLKQAGGVSREKQRPVAAKIHSLSARISRPLVRVRPRSLDCSSIRSQAKDSLQVIKPAKAKRDDAREEGSCRHSPEPASSEADRLVAVLPMIRKRSRFAGVPIWKLAGAANIHSSQFDILQSPGEAGEAAIPAFWNLFKRMPSWNMLELPLLPGNGAGMKLIRHASKD